MITVANLTYYPVKACRGFDVAESHVERRGLLNDRRMMIVTPKGEQITQRDHAKLAWVIPTLNDGLLTLSAPNFHSIQFAIQKSGPHTAVNIWNDKGVDAIDQGDTAAGWLSDWLGFSVRLVHIPDGIQRRLNPDYAVKADDHTGFADGYPILIASETSLQDLNARLDSPIPMKRFRPNIVLKDSEPFAEDTWKRIRIGNVTMALVKPCDRCVVTTINPETLEQGIEPLRTLNTFRKQDGGLMFGVNTIPLNEGEIKIGMRVEVLE